MGKIALAVVVAFVLLPPSSSVWAQGRFPLKHEEVKDPSAPLVRLGTRAIFPQPEKPAGLKVLPKDISGRPSYYVAGVGGREVPLVLYGSKTPKLFVDVRGDGDLSDQKPYQTAPAWRGLFLSAQSSTVYGPIAIDVPSNGQTAQAKFKVQLLDMGGDAHYLQLFPAEMLTGQAKLGGKSYHLGIVDGNLNGRYDDVLSLSPEPTGDWLGIDLDGDGKFDERMFESGEVIPLPRIMQVNDTYYSVNVEPDGSAISFEKTEPKLGTLDIGLPDAALTLLSDTGLHRLADSEGKWQLPAGRYATWELTLNRNDQKRARWAMQSVSNTGKLKDFEVREGETVALKAGPPLTLKTDVQQAGSNVSVGLSLVGQAGEEYAPGVERNGQSVSAPTLRILNESGKVLASGSFQYG